MKLRSIWISFFIFFFHISIVNAESSESFAINIFCSATKRGDVCTPRQRAPIEAYKLACEADVQNLKCDELVKEKPEWAPLMRKCDTESICKENMDYTGGEAEACLRGYKNALVDMGIAIKDLTLGFGELINTSWQQVKTNSRLRKEFLLACDKSLACKRDLARDNPRTQGLTDEDLGLISAGSLIAQNVDMNMARSAADRQKYNPENIFNRPYIKPDQPDNSQKLEVLLSMLTGSLQKQYTRYSCYNKLAQQELKCYALANVADPITLANYFSKSSRLMKAVGKEVELTTKISKAIPSLPKGVKVIRREWSDGASRLYYAYAEKLPDGKWVRVQKELPIDEISGAINANFTSGRDFFEMLAKSKAGDAHFAFIDVGSLRAVNKKFQAGEVAGDRYLKAVADEILKNGENKVTLARLGGDEFGLMIDSKDPKEVKRILDKIQRGIRKNVDGDAHQVFREEKVVRKGKYKEEQARIFGERGSEGLRADDKKNLRQAIDELAKMQTPDISVGATQVGSADDLESLLVRAESQAKEMKIQSALNFGRPVDKYKSKEIPRAKPNPHFVAEIAMPSTSDSWAVKAKNEVAPDLDSLPEMKMKRKDEIARIGGLGGLTLTRYEDQVGRSIYRIEGDRIDPQTGKKVYIKRDIDTRGGTGMPDGMHPEIQNLVLEKMRVDKNNTLLMPKVKSLRNLNYFDDGTKAGDEMLAAVAETINTNMRSNDLTLKLGGGDFLWSTTGVSPKNIQQVEQRLNEELIKNPKVKAIISREHQALTKQLNEAKKAGDATEALRCTQMLDALRDFKPQLEFRSLNADEVKGLDFKQVLKSFEKKFDEN